MNDRQRLGVILLLAFLVSTALRDAALGGVFGRFGFFEVALAAFGSASACFLAAIAVAAPRQLRTLRRAWRDVLVVNATTALAWLCYFGSLTFVEPAVANMVYSGVAPIAVVLFGAAGLRARDENAIGARERAAHAGLLATLGVLAWIVLSGRSGMPDLSTADAMRGLALAATSGITITAETIVAKRMNEAGVVPAAVLAVRFLLVTLIAGGAVLGGGVAIGPPEPMALGYLVVAALALIVAPIYLVQAGLAYTSPMTTNAVLALGPVLVLAAQALLGSVATSPHVVASIVLYAALAIAGNVLRARAATRPQRGPLAPAPGEP